MTAKKKTPSMYGISRIDDKLYRTHAWRVSLRRSGVMHVKNFADKKLGGKGRALQQAKRYRDQLIRKHPPLTRKAFCSILRRNNQTGVVGVCRFVNTYRLKDGRKKRTWYWEAIWPTTRGQHENLRFSVKKLGEEGAFKRALAARQRGMAKVHGVFWAAERGVV